MANADKSITEFDIGTLTESSLFVAADVHESTGYSTGRHSASQLGEGICGEFEYSALTTDDKTVFGAINELNSIAVASSITGTLEAGDTEITLNSASITENSLIDVYTDTYGVNPTDVSVADGSVTLTFEAQENDLGVKVVLRSVGEIQGN